MTELECETPDLTDDIVIRTMAIDARKGLLQDPEFRSMCDAGWKLRGYFVRRQWGDALLLDVSFVLEDQKIDDQGGHRADAHFHGGVIGRHGGD